MNKQKHNRKIIRTSLLTLVAITLFFSSGYAQEATLTWLGTLGGSRSYANGVSDDGLVVTGYSRNISEENTAFRWTTITGMQDLGTLGGISSEATGISADGSVIVGWSYDDNSIYRAFKWNVTDGMQDLGTGDWSKTSGVSANGSVIAVNKDAIAYRWTLSGGLSDLGNLGGNSAGVTGISADGSVLVGSSKNVAGDPYAFRWTAGTGMQQIGTFYSFAYAVSGDGNTATGSETGSAGFHRAFKWTLSGGFMFNIAGNFSQGNAVSGDGNIIVGDYAGGAFRYTTNGGLEGLNQVYSNLLTAGSELYTALDVSADGQFIVGYGKNGITGQDEAYILAIGGTTSIEESQNDTDSFVLKQNFPNPFYQSTQISYQLPISGQITLKVYDLFGKEVKTLVHEEKPAGSYEVNFDASQLKPGIYIYKLQAGSFGIMKKMILMK